MFNFISHILSDIFGDYIFNYIIGFAGASIRYLFLRKRPFKAIWKDSSIWNYLVGILFYISLAIMIHQLV
jgi:uncharacterized membrane protein YeiH